MTEKSYYAKLTKYYVALALELKHSIVWEAKFTRSGRIPFSCLPAHQELSLLQSERAYGYKIPDAGLAKKPFDGVAIYDAAAVIVFIYFNAKTTKIYEIPLRSFIIERESSKSKSCTQQRAAELGTLIQLK